MCSTLNADAFALHFALAHVLRAAVNSTVHVGQLIGTVIIAAGEFTGVGAGEDFHVLKVTVQAGDKYRQWLEVSNWFVAAPTDGNTMDAKNIASKRTMPAFCGTGRLSVWL